MKPVALALFLAAAPTICPAATFTVTHALDPTEILGTFEAPAAGGLLTSAAFALQGGIFDVLAVGPGAPIYLPASASIDGAGAAFGAVLNSVEFDYMDGPVTRTCEIGGCPLLFESALDDLTPGEWYIEDIVNFANVAFGYYSITPVAPVPVPAAGGLAAAGIAMLAALRRVSAKAGRGRSARP